MVVCIILVIFGIEFSCFFNDCICFWLDMLIYSNKKENCEIYEIKCVLFFGYYIM